MASRVLLHVGAPKTGTSFVQDVLFTHREELARDGLCYPADRFDAHFLAALDLMQLPWGGLEAGAQGAWDRLAAQVRAWPGTAIVSHEILGRATREQARRARESLGDADVEVVVSARDLARQIPAEWQENLKHRRTIRYADFLEEIRDPDREAELAQWFWGVQEIPEVLDRWGDGLPAGHVRVVTVPPRGADPLLLWRRFAEVFGLDADRFHPGERSNASLGVAEAALLRRLNQAVRSSVPNRLYRPLVREHLVHRTLALRPVGDAPDSPRLGVPAATWAWTEELSRAWVLELNRRGYAVTGDLEELVPQEPVAYLDPDDVDPARVAAAGVRALAAMTEEAGRLCDRVEELEQENGRIRAELDRAYLTPGYRVRQRLVGAADQNPVARTGLAAYRRLRGSSSRST